MCIGLFFDINKPIKNNELVAIIYSYYRTISNSSQIYRHQLKVRSLRFLARFLFPAINWA